MLIEEITPTLESLQAEIVELRRSVEKLQAAMSAVKPESDRAPKTCMSFEEAAESVRSDYSHLLHKLSQ
jgi:prefoldin subunit 5